MTRIALALALALSFAGIVNSAHASPNPAVDDGLSLARTNSGS